MDDRDAVFLGIDVQIRRGVPWCALDAEGVLVGADWFEAEEAAQGLARLVDSYGPSRCIVGIDAPRMPLPTPRTWSFSGGRWFRTSGKRGRHCELVVRALGLGNPQWTPVREEAPDWMRLGFSLFECAERAGARAEEVFPSASYRVLDGKETAGVVAIPLGRMRPGPKDMLDAAVAAMTVLRHFTGSGSEVGGGDGLGSIVLPAEVPPHPCQDWPSEEER